MKNLEYNLERKEKSLHWRFWIGPIIILLGFLLQNYRYYTFLRLVVCITSVRFALSEYEGDMEKTMYSKGWLVIFTVLAVLYNPFIPFHLERDIWTPVNIITIIIYVFHYRSYKKRIGSV